MLRHVIAFSLSRSALVLVGALLLVAVAAANLTRMPVDVFPELNAPTVVVMTEAGGLAADEVEQYVTFPVESAVNGLPGVRRVRSSSAISLSIVWVEFDWGYDLYLARQLVSERLTTASETLPPNAHAEIAPINSITGEVMLVSLTADRDSDVEVSPLQLRAFAEFDMRNRLLAVAGVSQVVAIGGELPEYQVNVRQDALMLYELTIQDVVDAAEQAHSTASAGYLPNVEGLELPIRQAARVRSAADIKSTLIKYHEGRPVTIGQVADVQLAGAPRRGTAAEAGEPAVVLSIQKAPGTNTLALTDAIDAALDDVEHALPEGVKLNRHVMRQSDFINLSLDNVMHVLRDAAIFVAIVLVLFLMNVRTTLITLTALPLSLAIALLALDAMNLSINVMTLGGFAVAIGALVDDAIIDVENVFRRLRENRARRRDEQRDDVEVVLTASNEIRKSIVFATVIITIVFVPLLFLQGLEGRFFQPLAISYIVSIMASLVVALTVTPALCKYLLARNALTRFRERTLIVGLLFIATIAVGLTGLLDAKGDFAAMSDVTRWIGATIPVWLAGGIVLGIRDIRRPTNRNVDADSQGRHGEREGLVVRLIKAVYRPSVLLAIRLRWLVLVLAFVATAASLLVASTFGTSFLPEFNEGTFTVFLMAPPGTSLEESDRLAIGVEKRLVEIEGVRHVVRRTGRAERDEHAEPVSSSEIEIGVEPGYEKEDVRREISAVLAEIPGITTMIGQPIEHRLSHVLSGTPAAIAINVYGDDLPTLRVIAKEIETELRTLPGARDVAANREVMVTTLPIEYRAQELAAYGLSPGDAAQQVEDAFYGATVAEVNEGVRRYSLVVRLAPEERERPDQLKDFILRGREGANVRLREVATVGIERASNLITRENTQRKAVVSCNVAEGHNLGHLVEQVRARVDPIVQRRGYRVSYGGQFEAQQSASQTIMLAGAVVMIVIVFLLVMALDSVRAALLVMVNLPLALIGGVAAVFVAESPDLFANSLALVGLGEAMYRAPVLSVASLVGFITLFGIAVRNGILLVNHYQQLMSEGLPLREAVVQGSMERLIPILMTALTAVLGLVPLALAAGEPGSELLAPLALVVLGGLVTSTFLNAVVVPAGFVIVFGGARRRKAANPDAQPETTPASSAPASAAPASAAPAKPVVDAELNATTSPSLLPLSAPSAPPPPSARPQAPPPPPPVPPLPPRPAQTPPPPDWHPEPPPSDDTDGTP